MLKTSLNRLYSLLLKRYGLQSWWPVSFSQGQNRKLEIMLGAILTQNTAWKNVELALANLSCARVLSWKKLHYIPQHKLTKLIRPAGYYNQKAEYIKNLVKKSLKGPWQNNDSLADLRQYFLSIKGIGEETADSILLYALGKPIFVVDAYTRRLFSRFGFIPLKATYTAIQDFVQQSLTLQGNKIKLYQEFHALIVRHNKEYCHPKPRCEKCFLKKQCRFYQISSNN